MFDEKDRIQSYRGPAGWEERGEQARCPVPRLPRSVNGQTAWELRRAVQGLSLCRAGAPHTHRQDTLEDYECLVSLHEVFPSALVDTTLLVFYPFEYRSSYYALFL